MGIVQVPSLRLAAMQHQGICIAPEGLLLFIENTHPAADPDTPFIVLPPLPILDRASRNMSKGVHGDMPIKFGLEADARVRRLIRELSEGMKAEKGTAALQRWLLYRMRTADDGDPAMAAILNPSEQDVRKTLSAYFACDGGRYWNRYTTVPKPLATSLPPAPDGAADLRTGRDIVPGRTPYVAQLTHCDECSSVKPSTPFCGREIIKFQPSASASPPCFAAGMWR